MLLAIVAKRNWELEQLVVSSDADETQEVINVMEKKVCMYVCSRNQQSQNH